MPAPSKKHPLIEKWLRENPLYLWRKRNFHSMDQLGQKLGCNRQQIYAYETGYCKPCKERAARLLEFTGVTLDMLDDWKLLKPEITEEMYSEFIKDSLKEQLNEEKTE